MKRRPWADDTVDDDDRIEQAVDDREFEFAGQAAYFGEGRIRNYPDGWFGGSEW